MIKSILFPLVLLFTINMSSQKDTISIFYNIGAYKLNKESKQKIQTKLDKLKDSIKYHVEIISSCDFLGSNKSNLVLSAQRAITVRDLLLVKKNITISSVTYKGVGELATKGVKRTQSGINRHRRTSIIFKNETQFLFSQMAESKSGEVFILKSIVFDPARHLLKKKSLPIIKQLLKVLQENPKLEIEIHGHVCCGKNPKDSIDGYDKDTKTYNLSENRAKHLYNYLILKKIDSTRLVYKGHGFLHPLTYPELNQKDKLSNRRVEIKVVKN